LRLAAQAKAHEVKYLNIFLKEKKAELYCVGIHLEIPRGMTSEQRYHEIAA
jgi:hypothetical protein